MTVGLKDNHSTQLETFTACINDSLNHMCDYENVLMIVFAVIMIQENGRYLREKKTERINSISIHSIFSLFLMKTRIFLQEVKRI